VTPGTGSRPGDRRSTLGEPTAFLYPFIDAEERDDSALRQQLAASARTKTADSQTIRRLVVDDDRHQLDRVAALVTTRMLAGSVLLAMGNGGSATDADGAAGLFAHPPWGRPLPARSLAADQAVLTALGNDIGFTGVFARQLMATTAAGNVLLGFSTSGNSDNLLEAFTYARQAGMVTVGFAGHDGGRMAQDRALDACFVVRSDSVHRVQEAQNALCHELWRRVQQHLRESEPA